LEHLDDNGATPLDTGRSIGAFVYENGNDHLYYISGDHNLYCIDLAAVDPETESAVEDADSCDNTVALNAGQSFGVSTHVLSKSDDGYLYMTDEADWRTWYRYKLP
jgi:hypothetical protein